jgi:hypothetical protein
MVVPVSVKSAITAGDAAQSADSAQSAETDFAALLSNKILRSGGVITINDKLLPADEIKKLGEKLEEGQVEGMVQVADPGPTAIAVVAPTPSIVAAPDVALVAEPAPATSVAVLPTDPTLAAQVVTALPSAPIVALPGAVRPSGPEVKRESVFATALQGVSVTGMLAEEGQLPPQSVISRDVPIQPAAEFAASGKILPAALAAVADTKGALLVEKQPNLTIQLSRETPEVSLGKLIPEVASLKAVPDPVKIDLSALAAPDARNVVSAQQPLSQPVPALVVDAKVGAPGWDGAIGQKVVWMASQNQQVAEIHLNPPNLGPIEVRLTISNDQANAFFVSPHAGVRDAIEAALPRLREMLADSGITLGNVGVGAESFAQSKGPDQYDEHSARSPRSLSALPSGIAEVPVAGLVGARRHGMVDTFA